MTLHILFDDVRDLNGMDIIIRNPDVAYEMLYQLQLQGNYLYLDNDMGSKVEGHHLLRRILEDKDLYPKKVVLVTSNSVAAENMRQQLKTAGYQENPNRIEYDWQE